MTERGHFFSTDRSLGKDSALALTGPALRDVIAHRLAQIEKHGYDREHDAGETPLTLTDGALSYLGAANDALDGHTAHLRQEPDTWPWETSAWKPGPPRRMLVKAAALILAAIDRIDANTDPDQRRSAAGGASPFPEAGGDAPTPSDRRRSAADGASPLPQTGGDASVLPPDQRHPAADGASPSTVCGDAPPQHEAR